MRLREFAFHRPGSLAEAFEMAAGLPESLFLAGGTEVIPEMKRGRDRARHLISLRSVPGLAEIRETGGTLVVGALAPHEEVARSALVRRLCPVLAEAARSVGSVQVRRQGTIGGNFCGAVPCADTPPACIVSGATLAVVSPRGGRTIEAEAFFIGPRQHVLEPDEVLTEIRVPREPPGSGAAYARFGLRAGMSVAVAAVAARLVLEGERVTGARVALGAVAPVPLRSPAAEAALAGAPATEASFAAAARAAAEEARPITDIRGSEGYRRDLVRVLARRAFERAAARARGERGAIA